MGDIGGVGDVGVCVWEGFYYLFLCWLLCEEARLSYFLTLVPIFQIRSPKLHIYLPRNPNIPLPYILLHIFPHLPKTITIYPNLIMKLTIKHPMLTFILNNIDNIFNHLFLITELWGY